MFLNETKKDSNVQGILFFGSAQRNQEKETSDLDFYLIIAGDMGWSSKKYYKDVPVEAYFYPYKLWRKLVCESVNVMHAFASGTAIYSVGSELSELIKLAKRQYDKGPEVLTSIQRNNWRIELTELFLDIEGQIDSSTSHIFGGWSIIRALEGYCALNRIWLVKPSKIEEWVSEHDTEIKFLLKQYRLQPDLINLKNIIEYILTGHNGRILEYEGPREKVIL
jgi:hypothetical protein